MTSEKSRCRSRSRLRCAAPRCVLATLLNYVVVLFAGGQMQRQGAARASSASWSISHADSRIASSSGAFLHELCRLRIPVIGQSGLGGMVQSVHAGVPILSPFRFRILRVLKPVPFFASRRT